MISREVGLSRLTPAGRVAARCPGPTADEAGRSRPFICKGFPAREGRFTSLRCILGRLCLSSNFVSNRQILVIDFEPVRLKATEQLFQDAGLSVVLVGSSTELNSALAGGLPPVVVIEPMLPGHDGFALCRALKRGEMGPVPHVIVAARIFRGQRYKSMAKDSGADIFLQRPDHDSLLLKVVQQMLGTGDSALPAGKKDWEEQIGAPLELGTPPLANDGGAGPLDDFDWDQFETQFDKAFDGLTEHKSTTHPVSSDGREQTPGRHTGPAAGPPHHNTGPDFGPMQSGPIGPTPLASANFSKSDAMSAEALATLDKQLTMKPPRAPQTSPAATLKLDRSQIHAETQANAAQPKRKRPTLLIAASLLAVLLIGGYALFQYLGGIGTPDESTTEVELFRRTPQTSQPSQPENVGHDPEASAPGNVESESQATLGDASQTAAPSETPPVTSDVQVGNGAPATAAPIPSTPAPTAVAPPTTSNRVQKAPLEALPGRGASSEPGAPKKQPKFPPSTASGSSQQKSLTAVVTPTMQPPTARAPADTPSAPTSTPPEAGPEPEPIPEQDTVMTDPLMLDPPREEPMLPGGANTTKPTLIPSSRIEPNFPQGARQARLGGQVTLKVMVKADGTVGDVKILSEPDARLGLGKAAVAAVKRWRYSPGTHMGNPIDSTQTVVLNFKP